MINVSFIAIVPGFILAALTPAKVSDVETNSSAAPALKRPSVIYVRSFNISNTVAASGDATTSERPHLLGRLRGGEENTVIGRHRQQQPLRRGVQLREQQRVVSRNAVEAVAPCGPLSE